MDLVIAGSRSVGKISNRGYDYDHLVEVIDRAIRTNNIKVDCVVSGNANGPDKAGEIWAHNNGVVVNVLKPDWSKGRYAGLQNNKALVAAGDALLVLYDGISTGTKNTIDLFKKAGKEVYYA